MSLRRTSTRKLSTSTDKRGVDYINDAKEFKSVIGEIKAILSKDPKLPRPSTFIVDRRRNSKSLHDLVLPLDSNNLTLGHAAQIVSRYKMYFGSHKNSHAELRRDDMNP